MLAEVIIAVVIAINFFMDFLTYIIVLEPQNDPMGMKQLLEMFMMNNPAAFMNFTGNQNEMTPEMSMMLNALAAKQNKMQIEIEPPENRMPRNTEGQSNVKMNCPINKFNLIFDKFKPLLKRASTHVALAYYIYSKTVSNVVPVIS
jgi:hypothetical protein